MKTFFFFILPALILYLLFPALYAQERIPIVKPGNNPMEFSDVKKWSAPDGTLCVPEYSTGCSMGDGFTDFAVEEIENYGSGCADLNGTGWSQYLGLGPAVLFPGITHDFIMQTGYDNQNVTIWIDFNDDIELTADEIILFDYELEDAGQFYTVSVTIPTDALLGMHYMRARTNWQSSCDDPCEPYNYGEAEDYYVIIGNAETGSIEGFVTELDGGAPVEDALITLEGIIPYSATTGIDGSYLIESVFIGDYGLSCIKQGYNIQNTSVTIEEDIILYQDFELTQPEIFVNPLVIAVTLPQNATTQESVIVENNGNGQLDWAASIQIDWEKSKDYFDLQFEYPVAQGAGEAGIESDGNYLYTTKWNGGDILKYDIDGNYLGSFTIPGVSGLRDLAYDGTFFYGSAAIPVVWEMDFENQELISSFTAPTSVRAIAYNESEDVFYANNYSSPVIKFDKSGNNLGEFDTGPEGENYYGFAYDQASFGGPYLWGYAQSGESMNEIVQMQLPSGTETGFTLDVTTKLSGPVFNTAGGLYTHPNLIFGKWTLGGLVQNEWIWGLELAAAQTWIWVEPNVGSLNPGGSEDLTIQFDATDLEPGEYIADIFFTSYPEVGNPVIEVTLNVSESAYFPCNLTANINCTDVELSWSVCPPGSPEADSFYVYRDDTFLLSVTDTTFTDVLLDPETTYLYEVTAFYDGLETIPSTEQEATIPFPGDLEPTNLEVSVSGNIITLSFDPPSGCLIPDIYNLYRDGELIGSSTQGSFQIDWGNYEYFVTAVYYFGESGPSNTVLITNVEETEISSPEIFPNPARDLLNVYLDKPLINITLVNNTGMEIYKKSMKTSTLDIDVSGYDTGVYFLILETENNKWIRKVIIE